jgi:hypothetical protein
MRAASRAVLQEALGRLPGAHSICARIGVSFVGVAHGADASLSAGRRHAAKRHARHSCATVCRSTPRPRTTWSPVAYTSAPMARAEAEASGPPCAWIDETSWRPNAHWMVSENGRGEVSVVNCAPSRECARRACIAAPCSSRHYPRIDADGTFSSPIPARPSDSRGADAASIATTNRCCTPASRGFVL